MKRMDVKLACLALSFGVGTSFATESWRNGERVSLWPEGGIPDFQVHQIAAMTDEVTSDAEWASAHRMPYLEWFEVPEKPNGGCLILISGEDYNLCGDLDLIELWKKRFTRLGFQTVNLVYRTPRPNGGPFYRSAWQDGQRAVRMVRSEASRRGYDPEKIGVIGVSAGGHLATLLATSALTASYGRIDELDDVSCHVNWCIANAPAYNSEAGADGGVVAPQDGTTSPASGVASCFAFDEKTCPIAFQHGADDPYTPNGSARCYRELRKRNIPSEVHFYADRRHGAFGLERAIEFVNQMQFVLTLPREVSLMSRYPNDEARAACERENVWPEGKMPNAQSHQCIPYLEWHLPKRTDTKAIQIIYSGGSYSQTDEDGFEVAPLRRYLNERGMTVVTLKYRTPRPQNLPKHMTAWQDLQRTIRIVRSEAKSRGLDPNNIGIAGSSAGGHLTLMGATSSRTAAYQPIDALDELSCGVQWAIAMYPAYALTDGLEDVNTKGGNDDSAVLAPEFKFDGATCPMCFLHGDSDDWSAMNSVKAWERMRQMGVQCDLHTLATRNHCFQKYASPGTGSFTWLERVWDFLSHRAVVGFSGYSPNFPFGSAMTVRHQIASAEAIGWTPKSVPKVNDGMPMTDSVATLYAELVDFCASNDESWEEGTNAIGGIQASLTLKLENNVCTWMGYTGDGWKKFAADGAVAEEGEWILKVDIDYTVVPALIRYSVRKPTEADYVVLLCDGDAWVPVGAIAGEQKINRVLLYGTGETGLVQAKSGARGASAGSIVAANNLTLESTNLVITVGATDAWGVDTAKVVINGQERSAALVNGEAQVDVSDLVAMGEDYTYDVSLTGSYRGKDMSLSGGSKEVFIGNTDTWFAYKDGVFTNATADANLTNEGGVLSAAQISPRGIVNPSEAAPGEPVAIEFVSTMVVAGAVQESALEALDAGNAKSALTVVRYNDGSRGWAVSTVNGWMKLTGAGISAVNGTYTVRMSFNYKNGAKTVTYAIRNASDEFVTLADANGDTAFGAGDAVVAKASLLGGTVSSLFATCKSVPKTEEDSVVDPAKGETEITVKAADVTAAGEKALAAIVVPSVAGSTPEAEAAYRSCFKVVSTTPVSEKPGSYGVVLALNEAVVQPDEVTKDIASELDAIAEAFATGSESGAITIDAKNLKPGLWYSIASSAAVDFETKTEGMRVQATGASIKLKVPKPDDVENACFFRVLVNAVDKFELREKSGTHN